MGSVYIVCPVTSATPQQTAAIRAYVEHLEADGHRVYWPARDTIQDDPTGGWNVCEQNARAIMAADEIHVWWDRTSRGSIFDIGVAWALRMLGKSQRVVLANTFDVPEGKAFEKVLLQWAGDSQHRTQGRTE